MSIPEGRVQGNYTKHRTKKGQRTFLGVVSFYRRYINRLAKYTATLFPATVKAEPSVVVWNEDMSKSFHTIRDLVCNECALEIPLREDAFSLVTEASGLGLGAVLQVMRNDEWVAAAFYSRQTRGPESTKYQAAVVDGHISLPARGREDFDRRLVPEGLEGRRCRLGGGRETRPDGWPGVRAIKPGEKEQVRETKLVDGKSL